MKSNILLIIGLVVLLIFRITNTKLFKNKKYNVLIIFIISFTSTIYLVNQFKLESFQTTEAAFSPTCLLQCNKGDIPYEECSKLCRDDCFRSCNEPQFEIPSPKCKSMCNSKNTIGAISDTCLTQCLSVPLEYQTCKEKCSNVCLTECSDMEIPFPDCSHICNNPIQNYNNIYIK